MRSLEMIIPAQWTRAASKDIRNAVSVDRDSMGMMNCTSIVGTNMKGATYAIEGMGAASSSITSTTTRWSSILGLTISCAPIKNV